MARVILSLAWIVLAAPAMAQCEITRLDPAPPIQSLGYSGSLDPDYAVLTGVGRRVSVFHRSDSGWDEVRNFDSQGTSIFFSGVADQSAGTVITGSQEANNLVGGAYVYEPGSNWSTPYELQPSDAQVYDALGAGVAIHGDTAVVAGTMSVFDVGACGPGKAFVFERSGASWVETAAFYPHGFFNTMIMYGVDVATDGNTIAICAPTDDEAGIDAGAVYVYERGGSGWVETLKILAPGHQAFGQFGTAVAVQGNFLLVGASHQNAGKVYFFRRSGGVWNLVQTITSPLAQDGDRFGEAVALCGSHLVIGAPKSDAGGSDRGAYYAFRFQGGTWVEDYRYDFADANDHAQLGTILSLEGNQLLVSGSVQEARLISLGVDTSARYCTATQNSSGLPAQISAEGCDSVMGNALTLRAVQLPPNQVGLFLFSTASQQTPFFDGFLCLQPPLHRLPLQVSSAAGELVHTLDYQRGSATRITAGSAFAFQAFFRDPWGSTGANLSDGIWIGFQP